MVRLDVTSRLLAGLLEARNKWLNTMPIGGSATINGVLYQTLRALSWAAQLSLRGVVRNEDLESATLVIEPAGGGGDLRVGRVMEQMKSRPGGGTYPLNSLLNDVLPDLYRAVPDDLRGEATYRLVTEARRGDWLGAETFFRSLSNEVPERPLLELNAATEIFVGRGRQQTPASLFSDVITALRRHPDIREEPEELTIRKTWHLLARFEFVGEQAAANLVSQVERLLSAVIPERSEISLKRLQLCGWILENAARGPVVTTPSELLRAVNLSVEPIAALARVHERVGDCLKVARRPRRAS
jgi:hypothetical protein